MSLKKSALLVAAFGFAGQGYAQADSTLTTVHTLAKSMNLGLEYNAGLTFNDNKFTEVTGTDAVATSTIKQNIARIKVKGNLTDNAEYYFRINSGGSMDYAKVTWWVNDMFGITAGRDKIKQGGLETARSNYATIADSYYYNFLSPFNTYDATLGLHVKAAGTVSLQFVNETGYAIREGADGIPGTADDSTDANARSFNTKSRQPATILEWAGNSFGGLMPLVQVGLYDYKSMYFTVSGGYTMGGVDMALSIVSDQRTYGTIDATTGKSKDETNNITSVVAEGSFQTGAFRPFGKIAHVSHKQKPTDVKTNSAANMIDDNGMMIHIGIFGPEQGTIVRPYAALTHETGKFMEGTEEKSRSNMALSVGVAGEI